MKKCPKGSRRCSVNKRCVTKKRSRLASNKRCRRGTRKCADKKCYGKHKEPKWQFELHRGKL